MLDLPFPTSRPGPTDDEIKRIPSAVWRLVASATADPDLWSGGVIAEIGPHGIDLDHLEGEHPVDALEGWIAPAGVDALVLLAGVTDPSGLGVVVVASQSGPPMSVVFDLDGPDAGWPSHVGVECSGVIVDTLLRAMQRSTPPPEVDAEWLWTALWLWEATEVLVGSVDDAFSVATLGAQELAALHPAVSFEEVIGLDNGMLVEFCRTRHADHVKSNDWDSVRRVIAVEPDALLPLEVGPIVATWHDAGSFSRFVRSRVVALDLVASVLARHLTSEARTLLGAVVDTALAGEFGSVARRSTRPG